MSERPSIDEILSKGRARHKRLELGLGLLILGGGLAFFFATTALRSARVFSFGAIGVGALLIVRGLFGKGRSEPPIPRGLRLDE